MKFCQQLLIEIHCFLKMLPVRKVSESGENKHGYDEKSFFILIDTTVLNFDLHIEK